MHNVWLLYPPNFSKSHFQLPSEAGRQLATHHVEQHQRCGSNQSIRNAQLHLLSQKKKQTVAVADTHSLRSSSQRSFWTSPDESS